MSSQPEVSTNQSSTDPWDLQRRYFEEMGFDAWRSNEVPHYITNNQRLANGYAETIFALLKENAGNASPDAPLLPLTIIESGAGSGRLGYAIAQKLVWLCEQEDIPLSSFRYVLTDFTQSNLDFWRIHPCLHDFLAQGIMDIALFDLANPADLLLQVSGTRVTPAGVTIPLVFIANYVFDSVPQELFYCSDESCQPCQIRFSTDNSIADLDAGAVIREMNVVYDLLPPIEKQYYPEPYLENIRRKCQDDLNGYFFMPATAIRCLDYLRSVYGGLVVLTADKGGHTAETVCFPSMPNIIKHGSFSFSVNYHAIKLYCENTGGRSLFSENGYENINIACLVMGEDGYRHRAMVSAFLRFVAETGPDDYFSIYHYFQTQIDVLDFEQLVAFIRFSLHDSHVLGRCLHRFFQMAETYGLTEKKTLVILIKKCWENYFPIGEEMDLASRIGALLFEIGAYSLAVFYFRQSVSIYGDDTGTLFNLAACYQQIGEPGKAKDLLERMLADDPGNKAAGDLLNDCRMAI